MLPVFLAVVLVSIYKPILMLLVLAGWAWIVAKLDKDAMSLFLQRQMWNGLQIGAGALAFFLWIIIPYFWLGMILALLIAGGAIVGYAFFRNTQVSEQAKWTFSLDSFTQRIEAVQAQHQRQSASVHLLASDGHPMEVPVGHDPHVPAHAKFEELLDFALPRKGDRIDIVVTGEGTKYVVHIDGFKHEQPDTDGATGMALVNYLKEKADMDVEERRKRQSGAINFDAGDLGKHNLSISTQGSTREVIAVLRIDASLRSAVGIDKLGLLPLQKQQMLPVLAQRKRVVLVTAPAHQGLTTSLYSLLQEHDPYTQSVLTYEEEIAYEIEGVNHHLIDQAADPKVVADKLNAMLRQDPNVVMVSRLADAQMAKVIAGGAGEIRFYVGLRADDTFAALKMWLKAVGDPRQGANVAIAITAQRLLRKLCPTCRTPYHPDPDALRKLNLPADKASTLYKQSGQVMVKGKPQVCPECLGLAYRGRVGVFEVMTLDDQARVLIADNQFDQLRAHLRKQKMLWLQEAALARVVDGTTSISEAMRVLGGK